jgi:tetratricopeptide (TPR) repeat protein
MFNIINRNRLLKILEAYYNEEELKTLCFMLKVDYETLGAAGKVAKARELILYLERHGQVSQLIALIKQERPDILWSILPKNLLLITRGILGIVVVAIIFVGIVKWYQELTNTLQINASPNQADITTELATSPSTPVAKSTQIHIGSFIDCEQEDEIINNLITQLGILDHLTIITTNSNSQGQDGEPDLSILGTCINGTLSVQLNMFYNDPILLQVAYLDSFALSAPEISSLEGIGRLGRAMIYFHQNNYKQATNVLQGLSPSLSDNTNIRFLLGTGLLLDTQYEPAIQRYDELLQEVEDPGLRTKIYNNRGLAHLNWAFQQNEFGRLRELAIVDFTYAISATTITTLPSLVAMVYSNKGLAHYWVSEMEEADKACQIAYKNAPDNPWAQVCLAASGVTRAQNEFTCDEDLLREMDIIYLGKAQQTSPDLADIYYWRGSIIQIKLNYCPLDASTIEGLEQACTDYHDELRGLVEKHSAPLDMRIYMEKNFPCQ